MFTEWQNLSRCLHKSRKDFRASVRIDNDGTLMTPLLGRPDRPSLYVGLLRKGHQQATICNTDVFLAPVDKRMPVALSS